MRDDHVALLRCPHCQERLACVDTRQVGCSMGHRFDVARQGYLSLLPPHRPQTSGDAPDMVMARERLLPRHYTALRAAISAATAAACARVPGAVIDAGCGPGFYLGDASDAACRIGLGIDLSAAAARRAARLSPECSAIVADTRAQWPVRDGVAAVVLDVFAPRRGDELRRVLHGNGRLIVVTPQPNHLHELVQTGRLIGIDERKTERIDRQLRPWFTSTSDGERVLEWTMQLTAADLKDITQMGPSFHHRQADTSQNELAVTASVALTIWEPR